MLRFHSLINNRSIIAFQHQHESAGHFCETFEEARDSNSRMNNKEIPYFALDSNPCQLIWRSKATADACNGTTQSMHSTIKTASMPFRNVRIYRTRSHKEIMQTRLNDGIAQLALRYVLAHILQIPIIIYISQARFQWCICICLILFVIWTNCSLHFACTQIIHPRHETLLS